MENESDNLPETEPVDQHSGDVEQGDSTDNLYGETDHTQPADESGMYEGESEEEYTERKIKYQQRENVPEQPNYNEAKPVRTPVDKPSEKHLRDAISVLMEHPEYVMAMFEQLSDNDVSEEDQEYWQRINGALRHHPGSEGDSVSPFNRESSNWEQGLRNDNGLVNAGRVRYNSGGGKLAGDSAMLRLRAATGLGSVISIPLWHTGIWVKIKTPTASTLSELERTIVQNKMAVGRSTAGVAFSNASTYILEPLLATIFQHIYGDTYNGDKELREFIKVTDIPQLVWGFACSIYPDGFPFAQPCVANPATCNHVDYTTLHVPKLSWLDNSSISEYQSRIMSDRDGTVNDETLLEYTRQHQAPQERVININDDVSLLIAVPTIHQHMVSGNAWIDGIVEMTNEAFGQELRGKERDNYIIEQSQITQLRRYSHWIKEIRFSDDSIIEERSSVDKAVSQLSSDPDIREEITEGVESLIRDSVISAIGIPRYECPSCGGVASQDDSVTRLSEIIQLEVNEVFFTLEYTRVRNSVRAGEVKETS